MRITKPTQVSSLLKTNRFPKADTIQHTFTHTLVSILISINNHTQHIHIFNLHKQRDNKTSVVLC